MSVAFAGNALVLDRRPLTRDATFYALSIVTFAIFSWDGKFEFYESIVMLVMYILYIILPKYNRKLMELIDKCISHKLKGSSIYPSDDLNHPTKIYSDDRKCNCTQTEELQCSATQNTHRDYLATGDSSSGSIRRFLILETDVF